jgi:hypothetical protein
VCVSIHDCRVASRPVCCRHVRSEKHCVSDCWPTPLPICICLFFTATKNATMTLCGVPVRSRVATLRATNITLGVISALCVLLRILYKAKFSVAELGWDDYSILATLIIGVPQTIITDKGTIAHGLGRDIWTIPFNNVIIFIRWFYVMEVLYFLILATLKLSLLFFFLRIFPARNIRRMLWGTIAINIAFGIAFVFAAIFQCNPVSYYWTRLDDEQSGKCININGLGWANAAISIALDVWMLGLPLSQVFSLNLAWKKKISVALMFCVGTLFVPPFTPIPDQTRLTKTRAASPSCPSSASNPSSTSPPPQTLPGTKPT